MEWLFDKIDFSLFKTIHTENNWLDMLMNNDENPEKEIYAAIIGVDEKAANAVRSQFYAMKKGRAPHYHVADLGNLKTTHNQDENALNLFAACKNLLDKGIIPIVIAAPQELALPIYAAISAWQEAANLAYFDAALTSLPKNSFIQNITQTSARKPFNLLFAGHQEYLCDREELAKLENLQYETISLGKIKQDFDAIEPYIRDASMFCFHANTLADPIGFTGEEASQLAWYAGMNENLATFALLGFSDKKHHTKIAASMIWYFIEGTYQSACEKPNDGQAFERFIVSIDKTNDLILFVKSPKSKRWWYEFENEGKKTFLPCGYNDYEAAVHGEIPESWWKAHNRIYFQS
jgi:formiminoglutamase